jgi:hypothetical protein
MSVNIKDYMGVVSLNAIRQTYCNTYTLRVLQTYKTMIKSTIKSFFIFSFLFISTIFMSHGQDFCDFSSLYKKAMDKIDTGYIYTKSFRLKPTDKESVNHTIVMVAGKNYHLYVESADSDEHYGILATLKDETDKQVIATNFDKNKQLLKHAISFTCTKTGIYHLILDYTKAKIHCGVAVLSFKKELQDSLTNR